MCPSCIQVTSPQSADTSIFNAMYLCHSAGCAYDPGNNNCHNTDYIQQGCNHYLQSGGFSNGYLTVTLEYSTNCQANFPWARATSGYVLYRVDIEPGANSTQWPALTLTDYPGTGTW